VLKRPTEIALAAMFALAVAPAVANAQDIRLQSLDTLQSTGPTPQVIGGNPAPAGKWPATFVFKNAAGGGCTATAIGPRTILTAAHCIDDNATATVSTATQVATIICKHHPNYATDISADFALCVTNVDFTKPKDGFEQVNTNPALAGMNQKIQLLGYGCRQPGGGDGAFGSLYEGEAFVQQIATNDNYVRTAGGAAVCFGDSGGGAYNRPGPGEFMRRLIGVNSRGDINTNSWLSVTHKTDFLNWAKAWAAARQTVICGMNPHPSCRQ
jgi:hypothetical protein